MKTSEQIRLLKTQLDKIDDLEKAEDHEAYDAWHMQTELLLKKILDKDASEVQEFHRFDGKSAVIVSRRPDINAQRKTEAYFRDVKKSRSLLTGILDFLKSTEAGDTDTAPVNAGTLEALHEKVKQKCSGLYLGGHYPEAVEKGFKVVRDRLRELTTHETGSEAFGKGGLYIKGASAENVDKDFQDATKFLTMAIDQFRNEKSHTSDGKIEDPVRAYEYLALSSLAMHLLDNSEVREKIEQPKQQKSNKQTTASSSNQQMVTLDALQILALRLFGAMTDFKELLVSRHMSGSTIHPVGNISNPELLKELNDVDTAEFEANLDQMLSWDLLTLEYSSKGTPKYKLAKQGYDILKQHPELSATK